MVPFILFGDSFTPSDDESCLLVFYITLNLMNDQHHYNVANKFVFLNIIQNVKCLIGLVVLNKLDNETNLSLNQQTTKIQSHIYLKHRIILNILS